jgi:hypothetical protein
MGRGRIAIWLAFAVVGMLAYMFIPFEWVATLIAVLCFLSGSLLSALMFNRLATPEEKRLDLEDRIRNQH